VVSGGTSTRKASVYFLGKGKCNSEVIEESLRRDIEWYGDLSPN
jgi:hypothetical protein